MSAKASNTLGKPADLVRSDTALVRGMSTVECDSCGATLNEDPSLKEDERKPCPVCGSTERRICVKLSPIKITMDGTTGFFGPTVLNKYGAPKLSKLTECGAPPLDEPANYIENHLLNRIFGRTDPEPVGRLVLMFGRRVINAIREYRAGRDKLLEYLRGLPMSNGQFMRAMEAATHFEQCIASTSQAAAFFKRLLPPDQLKDFNDDRITRLEKMYARSKHFDEDVANSNTAPENITAPIWLMNKGISSTAGSITFNELHKLLTEMLQIFETAR